jgi:hypothetical protein
MMVNQKSEHSTKSSLFPWNMEIHSESEKFLRFIHHIAFDVETWEVNIQLKAWNNLQLQDHEAVSKSVWTGCLERELQMVQLSATRSSCIGILWVSLVSFAAITPRVASQRVFTVVVVYFVIDSVRKLRNIPSYNHCVNDVYRVSQKNIYTF